MKRRTLGGLVGLVLVSATMVAARSPRGTAQQAGPLLSREYGAYNNPELVVTLREVVLPPGGVGAPHRHPGPVVVYVLEGNVEVGLEGEPLKVYHKGEVFSERGNQVHQSTRNLSTTEPARLLAYLLSKKGEALTRPEP